MSTVIVLLSLNKETTLAIPTSQMAVFYVQLEKITFANNFSYFANNAYKNIVKKKLGICLV